MQRVYRFEFTVPETAIDRNGHVNNVEYVQWMQDVAILHSDANGCTAATAEIGATWVVRSHRVEYLQPARAGDRVTAFTWVAGMRKVRSLRKYRFVRVVGPRSSRTRRNRLGVRRRCEWQATPDSRKRLQPVRSVGRR